MEKHQKTDCPKCGEMVACKINSVYKCDCMDIQLTPAELQYIRERTDTGECLCLHCLIDLAKQYHSENSSMLT